MNVYENHPQARTNSAFDDVTKKDDVYETVVTNQNIPPRSSSQKSKQTVTKWNTLMIISVVSLVVGVAALAVAIGLFVSVSHKVDKLQDEQYYMQSDISSLNYRLSNDISNLGNQIYYVKDDVKDLSEVVDEQQEEINRLQNKTNSAWNDTYITDEELMLGYKELEDGWVTPFNGYKYMVTLSYKNWTSGWWECNEMGAQLAFRGIWDLQIRRVLNTAFIVNPLWIGVNDISAEGVWRWNNDTYLSYNGDYATPGSVLWHVDRPSDTLAENNDCAYMMFNGYGYDVPCSYKYPSLCEKLI